MPVHLKNKEKKFRKRKSAVVAMELDDWKEIEQLAATKGVDASTLMRGWILDRKTQLNMEQEA